ncbi:pilus assembly protein PilY [Cupriavidus respiraculi]|uniref:pilus assembly protein PilY n=1 Tax=Cupriavidus respiraculi TaxID=195930 RepID=UPI001C95BA61|nr:pilus assembly protein PilY [Cupriavidus respiraculi]MBY4948878.1 pilus assembly protein PilY [Cupriavidus respiraculi]
MKTPNPDRRAPAMLSPRKMLPAALSALASICSPLRADTVPPGQLPLSYVTAPAAYPWTGRLRAIAFRPRPAERTVALGTDAWEAGALLRARAPSTRALLTSLAPGDGLPERLMPLSWPALDAASRARLDADPRTGTPDGNGAARLDWLRGKLDVDGVAGLRPRDIPLASAAGARVLVVPPPLWHPGEAGHAAFHERHRLRTTTVWLGTADALLHGFDAIKGTELAAYLPRTLLPDAGAAATRSGRMAPPPCPRPDSVDASLAGQWRTLLLCGAGRPAGNVRDSAADSALDSAAGVFVLDISNVAGPQPIRLVWEIAASPELPLAPAGPVRAARLDDGAEPRWYAVVPTSPPESAEHAPIPPSLALLPLDKPPAAGWAGRYAIRRLALPAGGCDDTTTAPVVAVSIAVQANGMALAAYAVDGRGRLWRVMLNGALAPDANRASTCLYHLSATARADLAEAPALFAIPNGTLAVYGAGNTVAAVPDTGAIHPAPPRRILAEQVEDGFVLHADTDASNARPGAGWVLQLPRAGETLDRILPAASGYLGFVTRTPDGNLYAYLVNALSGESRTADDDGTAPPPMPAGLLAGRSGEVGIELVQQPSPTATLSTPGATTRETRDVSVWALDGANARRLARTGATRRTGRIGWRELVEPEAP